MSVSKAPNVPTPDDQPLTRREKLRLVGLVILKRVRFIAILAAVGLFIGYWETVKNYWDKWTRSHTTAAARELDPDHEFYCPMDPGVLRTTYEPNGDVPKCPICGMPLVVRLKGKKVELPGGIASRVQLTPERVAQAGIQTARVEYRPMVRQTTTVGNVVFDESRLSRVVSRVKGYVEKLYVDKTYAFVRQGDPLAEIYSPELYSAALDMLLSARGTVSERLLVEGGRKRLKLFGMDDQDIDRLLAEGAAKPRLVLRSPQTGYVMRKTVVAGSKVDDGTTLLEVADLSAVWIEADVYEKDIAFLRRGQVIEATVESLPGRVFKGEVALVYPELDAATRTNRVRFQVSNPGAELRPGMYATVQINTPLSEAEPLKSLIARSKQPSPQPSPGGRGGESLPFRLVSLDKGQQPVEEFIVVPDRAVVDTGDKKVVFVKRPQPAGEPDLFEGVEVQLGPRNGDYYPVLKGLKAGDEIAAAGAFLIDAETRLNPGAAATYFGASGNQPSGARSSTSTHRQSEPAPAETRKPEPAPPKPEPQPRVAKADFSDEELENLNQLPEADRKAAKTQVKCPISGENLGSMGVPVKITLRDRTVFLCCKGCVGKAKRSPDEALKKLGGS